MMEDQVFLGFDPGGDQKFGAAIIRGDVATTDTFGAVEDAAQWARHFCQGNAPTAIGIDTLLHWSIKAGGWRAADNALRRRYPKARNSVQSPNGLFGAMAVGGMALALKLREYWPDVILNETHPKVLFLAVTGKRYEFGAIGRAIAQFGQLSGLGVNLLMNEHELDAVISAWATRAGLSEHWPDLVVDDGAALFPAGSVKYLWPTASTSVL